MEHRHYENPLDARYASKEMSYLFSPQFKFSTWRKLWLALAEGQKKAGLDITEEQLKMMREHLEDIDFEYAAEKEKELRHDVMAHVHTFGKVCPEAEKIIHLGVTSAYVGDNTDLIQAKAGLELLRNKMLGLMENLKKFSLDTKAMETLAFTHFQPAQPTTVGKRGCLWLQEFLLDFNDLEHVIGTIPFRGIKGTTGTQASFLQLFQEYDDPKSMINHIEKEVAEKFGFKNILTITGQTYTRKIDFQISSVLSAISQSAAKMTTDLRLLAHKKEIEEPFEKKQIGSSAMAYKRNPMRSERVGSLARFVMSLTNSTAYTASTQWFERTLDDSANKRISIPQAFLAVDAMLDLLRNITSGLVVYPKVIEKNLYEELPFMLTENIMMESVKQHNANRQMIHEIIREESITVAKNIKEGGGNDLLDRLSKHPDIPLNKEQIDQVIIDSKITGRSEEMVEDFMSSEIDPLLKNKAELKEVDIKV